MNVTQLLSSQSKSFLCGKCLSRSSCLCFTIQTVNGRVGLVCWSQTYISSSSGPISLLNIFWYASLTAVMVDYLLLTAKTVAWLMQNVCWQYFADSQFVSKIWKKFYHSNFRCTVAARCSTGLAL